MSLKVTAPIAVYHYTHLADCTDARTLLSKGSLELHERGLAYAYGGASDPLSPALVAHLNDGTVVGVLSYRPADQRPVWGTNMVCVHPDHRRQGIHTLLFEALVKRAKEDGKVSLIESYTHAKNVESIEAQLSQGRILAGHHFEFVIDTYKEANKEIVSNSNFI